jgi:hypothetical protein
MIEAETIKSEIIGFMPSNGYSNQHRRRTQSLTFFLNAHRKAHHDFITDDEQKFVIRLRSMIESILLSGQSRRSQGTEGIHAF